nr:MAG TPA: hypothetical protein [Caudoviricetes sp.]
MCGTVLRRFVHITAFLSIDRSLNLKYNFSDKSFLHC